VLTPVTLLGGHRAEGPAGLRDRSSGPTAVAHRTEGARVEVIAALRRLRLTSSEIVECLNMALAAASRIRHLRTRPYRPQANGKAQRFIHTLLGGWASGAIYRDSAQRDVALAGWIDPCNRRRPGGALSRRPCSAVGLPELGWFADHDGLRRRVPRSSGAGIARSGPALAHASDDEADPLR
jgi:hypothetical protein